MSDKLNVNFVWNGDEGHITPDTKSRLLDFVEADDVNWITAADFLDDIVHDALALKQQVMIRMQQQFRKRIK